MFTEHDRQKYESCKVWVTRGLGTPDQLARYRSFITEYEARQAAVVIPTLFDDHQADPQTVTEDQPQTVTEDTPEPQIKIHSLLALSAGRGNHPGALQVWYIARSLDRTGSGVITRGDLVSFLRSLGVNERRRRRWLSDAKSANLIQEVRGGDQYRLTSLERAAAIYGCIDDIGCTALVPADQWAGKHWRSIAWGAFLESFGKLETITDQEGVKQSVVIYYPVSRSTLADISGVPEQTQRDLERHIPVIKRRNYKITETPAEHLEAYKRLEGVKHAITRRVTGKGAFVAVRLPDRRRLKSGVVKTLGFGRAAAIRKNNQDKRGHAYKYTESTGDQSSCVSDGSRPDDRSRAAGAIGGRPWRLFFRKADDLDKKAREMGRNNVLHIPELFRKLPGGRFQKCGWWAVEPLLVPAHP